MPLTLNHDGTITGSVVNTDVTNTRVGIGTSTPEHMLHLKGSYPYIAFEDTDNANTSIGSITGNSDGNIYYDANFNNINGVGGGHRWRINGAASTPMYIDQTTGLVLMPNQPAFAAVRNSTFSYTGGSGYVVINNWHNTGKNVFSIGNHFNYSTGRFTAPVAGVYTFKFQILLSGVNSGDDSIHVAFYQNALITLFGNIRAPGSSANEVVGYGAYLPVIGTFDTYCSANDTIDLRLSSSGNIDVYGGSDWSRFSGYLVG
jgi:hypothetical protein